ncbi:MAG: hypothetical protein MUP36_00610 [Demequinaceae bacterium]|nr:hypothetical protein [Demequinaceae bacterium]
MNGAPRIPALTAEQRRAALEKATAVRMRRKAFKDEVANGTHGMAAAIALAKADETLSGIKTVDLLRCLPGVGPRRAATLMAEVGIAPSRRIRGLGEHQVPALIARLTP